MYALTSQLRRVVISIESNIAEGYGRYSYQENIHFCRISRGSLNEVLGQLYIALDESCVSKQEFDVLYDDRDLSIGEKLAEADLIGLPLRLIVSDRSLEAGGYELKKREEKESQIIGVEDLMETIGKIIR